MRRAGGAHRRARPGGSGPRLARIPGGLERLGFFVCVEDLEDELIRAAGPALVAAVFAAPGDLGAGSQRKLRYARLLTEAIAPDRMPRPLEAVLAAV